MLKNNIIIGIASAALLTSAVAQAQDYAPTPRKMPRAPVARESLAVNKPVLPPSRTVTGAATIVDTERLKIGDVEMRLFGVVPPQLSATFGPQARAVLDSLTAVGAVSCVIRDRDRDGRFLATCKSAAGADLALELLRRGLAVSARGSLRPTELATPYLATEQAAQAARLGLWSVNPPPAASENAIREAAARNEAAKAAALAAAQAATAETETPAAKPGEPANAAPETKDETKPEPSLVPVTISAAPKEEKQATAPQVESVIPYVMPLENMQAAPHAVAAMGFFERYQLLVTGLLMLFTIMGIIGAVLFQRWIDKKEELRSIAAALRGELMAARAVCLARLGGGEGEERNFTWPRIRTLVFQAYVGRLGMLGAVLSRQIASIYGQASDYSAYFEGPRKGDAKNAVVSKRQALQTLMNHIEEVLPKLARVEQAKPHQMRLALPQPETHVAALPPPTQPPEKPPHQSEFKSDSETAFAMPETPDNDLEIEVGDEKTENKGGLDAEKETSKKLSTPPLPPKLKKKALKSEKQVLAATAAKTTATVAAVTEAVKETVTEKAAPLWDSIRKFTTERPSKDKTFSMEDHVPDYAALSEEEAMEALAYGGDLDDIEIFLPEKKTKVSKAG